MKKSSKRKVTIALTAAAGLLSLPVLTACESDADKASYNMSQEAEQFNVQREIIGTNTRSGEYLFHYVGRCSLESGTGDSSMPGYLQIMCKHGPNDYRKHYEKEATDLHIHTTQLEPIDVSVYHTKILVKPENLIPEFDLEAGEQ